MVNRLENTHPELSIFLKKMASGKRPYGVTGIKHGRFERIGKPHKVTIIGRNEPCPCGSNKKYKNCCIK